MLTMMTAGQSCQWRKWKRGPVFPTEEKRRYILAVALEHGCPLGPLSLLRAAIKKAGVEIDPKHKHPTWWYKVLYQLEYEGLFYCKAVRSRGRSERSLYSLTKKGRREALQFLHLSI